MNEFGYKFKIYGLGENLGDLRKVGEEMEKIKRQTPKLGVAPPTEAEMRDRPPQPGEIVKAHLGQNLGDPKTAQKVSATLRRGTMAAVNKVAEEIEKSLGDDFKTAAPKIRNAASAIPLSIIKTLPFALSPILRPQSLWGNLFASNRIVTALASEGGQSLQGGVLGALGASGRAGTPAGAAIATGAIMAGLLALGAALKALTEIVKGTIRAFEAAHKLYADALQSGTSLRVLAKMQTVGGIMGTDSAHAMAFSGSNNAAKQVQRSVDVFAAAAPDMAEVVMQFRILGVALREFFTLVGKEMAGSLRSLIVAMTSFVRILTDAGLARAIGLIVSGITWVASALLKLGDLMIGVGALILNFFTDLINNIPEIISKLIRGNTAGNKLNFQFSEKALANLKDLLNPPGQIANDNISMARQLPASSWEKMGLVIGGIGGGTDYTKQIAVNTRITAVALTGLIQRGTQPHVLPGIQAGYPAP